MPAERRLRNALLENAVFTGVCGVALIGFCDALSLFLGLSATALYLIGAALLGFAAELGYQATRRRVSTTRALVASGTDIAWAAASVIVLIGWPGLLSPAGRLALLLTAAVVVIFAGEQLFGVRRLRAIAATRWHF